MTHQDLDKAVSRLHTGGESCVLQKGQTVYASRARGIKPLCDLIAAKTDVSGFCAADRIVGKAAAMLYLLLGVKAVYADVMTETAKSILTENGIDASFGMLTDAIINRAGNGPCPMEEAVRTAETPAAAYEAILSRLRQLSVSDNNMINQQ